MPQVDTYALPGSSAQTGCGCGGSAKSDCGCGGQDTGCGCGGKDQHDDHGCGCGGDKSNAGLGVDLGQRFSLDATTSESTATDPFPSLGASGLEVCTTIFAQGGAATLTLVVLGTVDGDNWISILSQAITSGVGYVSFNVTGLAWRELRIGARASGGSVAILFSLYAYRYCA